ncbi:MAG: hypothetical protein HOV83_31130, partial [Catenulispora sp.]|nr:hypothetical protein [Catenulispora sp.]
MEFLVIGIIIAAIALVGVAALLYRARGSRRPVEQPPRQPVAPPPAKDS